MAGTSRSTRNLVGTAVVGVGILLLLVVPLYLVFLAFSGSTTSHIAGTLLILTVVGGMMLVVLGASLRD